MKQQINIISIRSNLAIYNRYTTLVWNNLKFSIVKISKLIIIINLLVSACVLIYQYNY